MQRITLSCLKADVGSIGGHTKPSIPMMQEVNDVVARAKESKLILDGRFFFTGDDINVVMSHTHGKLSEVVHLEVALHAFKRATKVAQWYGLYGAGQDLLVDAPSLNLRGAGPGVAEITFDHEPGRPGTKRPAESFMVFAADKCGPGAYNLPLYLGFADPMYCSGLLLSPKMHTGFHFTVIDMDQTDHDAVIELDAPEDLYKIAALLRDNERFAIEAIHSRAYPDQQCVAVSAQRLHNIAGTYTGKDDPVAIVRNQGIFPAPEELVSPWSIAHYVGGGARGSHVMPIMPVPVGTPVTGPYCLPLVSAVGFSMAADGTFTNEYVDFFDTPAWSHVRDLAQRKALEMRRQGFFGAAMLPIAELEYGGIKTIMEDLMPRFVARDAAELPHDAAVLAHAS